MNYTLPIGLNVAAWDEWCDYRKSVKKKVSDFAARKQFNLLLKYSEAQQQEIIDHSIANDYQGLFDLKQAGRVAVPERGFIEKHTDKSWREGL